MSPGHRTRPLMNHNSDHVISRRRSGETPHPASNRCVEGDGAMSLAVQTACSDWPHWIMTTDPVSAPSSRRGDTTELAGTPCGTGNPRERMQCRAWGRLRHAPEVKSSLATWGRSRPVETPNQALKVWTWGRTTLCALLDVEPRRGCSEPNSRLGVA